MSYLYLSLDLEAEGFIPLWVWAVRDGPCPQLLLRGSRQPEAYKAVCLANCPSQTRVGEKEEKSTYVQRGESVESKSLLEQRPTLVFRFSLDSGSNSPEMVVLGPQEGHRLQAICFTEGAKSH